MSDCQTIRFRLVNQPIKTIDKLFAEDYDDQTAKRFEEESARRKPREAHND
jgi:hypothetical protein